MLHAFRGQLHVDEGYYHLVPTLILDGLIPYRDFFWVQTPLYPYLTAFFVRIVGTDFLSVRLISVGLSVGTFLLAGRVADRIGGGKARFITAGLIAFNPLVAYHLAIIKLYAWTAFLLVLAMALFTAEFPRTVRYGLAAFALALGTAIRLTILPGLVFLVAYALVAEKGWRKALTAALVGGITLAALSLPLYLQAPEQFLYGTVGYHLEKEAFGLLRQMVHKLDAAASLVRECLLACVVAALVGWRALSFWTIHREEEPRAVRETVVLWGILLSVLAIHLTSQMPYMYRYLTSVFPAAAILLGAGMAPIYQRILDPRLRQALTSTFIVGCLLTPVAGGKGELVGPGSPGPAERIRIMARALSSGTSPAEPVVTFTNSVAVQADRSVLPGQEMNVLTYHPSWPEERCRAFRITNKEMLLHSIREREVGAFLLTPHTFIGNFPVLYNPGEEGARPAIMREIGRYYEEVAEFPDFGYFHQSARLYVPRR